MHYRRKMGQAVLETGLIRANYGDLEDPLVTALSAYHPEKQQLGISALFTAQVFLCLYGYAGYVRLFVLLVLIMAAALGSESQKLDTRKVSRSELFQESKQQMRNGWRR